MKKPILSDFGLTEENIKHIERIKVKNYWGIHSAIYILIMVVLFMFNPKTLVYFWFIYIANFIILGLITDELRPIIINKFYPTYAQYCLAVEQYTKSQKDFWLRLSGLRFEKEVAELFSSIGYDAQLTPPTGDGGIDIILNGNIFVQCKAHKKPVGPHSARDLYGAMADRNITKGILISLGGFTKGVHDFCYDKSIQLIDLEGLLKIRESNENN